MSQYKIFATLMAILLLAGSTLAGHLPASGLILEEQDGYEISFGEVIEAYHGQENLFIPVWLTNVQPVEYVHLLIQYDASVLDPISVAPAMFFQHFYYNLNTIGRIEIELECDLLPPPAVPPVPAGDTVLVYIAMNIIVDQLDRDIESSLTFCENPNTPFPDNFLMLDNGWFIVQPQLLLTPGIVYIFNPLYGDLNLNTYAYEMGDVITFIRFLNGQIQFNARQMANSDCNRDGILASISDLVYMINVINGEPDTLFINPPGAPDWYELESALQYNHLNSAKSLDINYVLHIFIEAEVPLGGFTISVRTPDDFSRIGEVALSSDVRDFMLVYNCKQNELTATGFSLNSSWAPAGNYELMQIPIQASQRPDISNLEILSQDFSDAYGKRATGKISFELESVFESPEDKLSGDEKSKEAIAYPNPFNSQVVISLATTQPGRVTAEIFDVLGRKVNTLKDGYENTGQLRLIWDGRNDTGDQVATGIYLCRLRLEGSEKVIKLHYLK